ncbi:MAG: hypothetical protein KGI57_12025 [Hyphomicrobiales bacterium]|nr:hypothetical protein [Hyphomicrobiales bacterium]MDE2018416.1 hypothetical protein [Hyphomicrobiales bacterium]
MNAIARRALIASALTAAFAAALSAPAFAAGAAHRLVVQIDTADAATMGLALNNVENTAKELTANGGDVAIDIVAFGPGLNMLRADKSPAPIKDRIARLKESIFPATVQFSACGNTKKKMEKAEGHPISLVPQATLVSSGVVQIMKREETGWSYLRP